MESPGRLELCDQQSTDRRLVRLPCRSNNIVLTRAQPSLVPGSHRDSEVEQAWDEVDCSWSDRSGIVVGLWLDCHSSDMVFELP